MLEPILAEDSTILKLVSSLEGIVKDLKEDATHHDYFVALLIVFLAESGFHATTTDNCYSEWYAALLDNAFPVFVLSTRFFIPTLSML